MRVLLDTHIFLWAISAPLRLSRSARKLIDAADVYISAASIWEISIKTGLGKLKADPIQVLDGVAAAGFSMLPVTGTHAGAVASLPRFHRDPFDRLLIAQAATEPMILLTADEALPAYGQFVRLA
jgi:PIN domain nuclease of toxin-antitoxin system